MENQRRNQLSERLERIGEIAKTVRAEIDEIDKGGVYELCKNNVGRWFEGCYGGDYYKIIKAENNEVFSLSSRYSDNKIYFEEEMIHFSDLKGQKPLDKIPEELLNRIGKLQQILNSNNKTL